MAETVLDLKGYGLAPRIRYSGVFDYGELLNRCRRFYTDQLYILHEKKYKHKNTQQGDEDEIGWEGYRKMNEYVKFIITLEFHSWNMADVEVIKGGQKVKMQKGRILIEVGAKLEMDYEDRFETSKFMESVRSFFHRYIIKPEIGSIYGDRLYYHAYKLQALIKDFFDMSSNYNAYNDMW